MLFSFLSLFSSLLVISSPNPILSILYLVLVFINFSCLFFYLGFDFLAIIFLIVYVGAIAILFLFVVMLIPLKFNSLSDLSFTFPLASIISLSIFFIISIPYNVFNSFNIDYWDYFFYNSNTLYTFSYCLFNYYYLFFILSGFILLLASIAAVYLTIPNSSHSPQSFSIQYFTKSN